jgi:hypothetical protein
VRTLVDSSPFLLPLRDQKTSANIFLRPVYALARMAVQRCKYEACFVMRGSVGMQSQTAKRPGRLLGSRGSIGYSVTTSEPWRRIHLMDTHLSPLLYQRQVPSPRVQTLLQVQNLHPKEEAGRKKIPECIDHSLRRFRKLDMSAPVLTSIQ